MYDHVPRVSSYDARPARRLLQVSPYRPRCVHLLREKRLSSSSFTPAFVFMYVLLLPMMVMSTTSGALSLMKIGWGAGSYVVGMRLLVVCRWRRLTLMPLVGSVSPGAANTAPTILRSVRVVTCVTVDGSAGRRTRRWQ